MNRISELRNKLGISMKEAAARLDMPYTTYVNYEKGTREPNSETLIKLSRFFGTTIDYLLGKPETNIVPPGFEPLPRDGNRPPLSAALPAGSRSRPKKTWRATSLSRPNGTATFTLLCEGDSMEPRIKDGDLVAIRSQPQVENGEIAAVRIDCEATLKHVYLYPDKIVLQPGKTQNYAPIVKIGEEMNDVTIEGKAVGLCRGL